MVDTYIGPLLSHTSPEPFWISWLNDAINIGKGSVIGKQVFLAYYYSTEVPPFKALAIKSDGLNGVWYIGDVSVDAPRDVESGQCDQSPCQTCGEGTISTPILIINNIISHKTAHNRIIIYN